MSREQQNSIVIVAGLPRSGTSLMMQMLERGGLPILTDEQRVADEDNPRGYYEYEPVKKTKENGEWLDQAVGKVVKMVYRLLYDLPTDRSYRVILMRRKIEEVLDSQAAMLDRSGNQGASLPPERLAEIFSREMDKIAGYLQEQSCFELLEVNFNEVVSDPLVESAKISRFLGMGWNDTDVASVVDSSLYRQRR